MPTKRKTTKNTAATQGRSEHDDTKSVTRFMDTLEHPLKPLIETIRATILSADKTITEGIKWNTASFYCYGWFATINIRAKTGVQVILHHGAKIRDDSTLSQTLDNPSHLLTWLAKDRATVAFANAEDFKIRQTAFKKVIKQWAKHQAHTAKPSPKLR